MKVNGHKTDGNGRRVIAELRVRCWSDGALSVEGPIEDLVWCLAALDNAKDAVRNHHSRRPIVVPPSDVSVPAPEHPLPEEKPRIA